MSDGTHHVVGKAHYRAGEAFAVGDRLTPTEAELSAFPERFEPAEDIDDNDDESAGGDSAEVFVDEASAAEGSDEDAIDAVLAAYVDDPQDYNALRSLASDVEGVPGQGLSKDELRQRLADALGE